MTLRHLLWLSLSLVACAHQEPLSGPAPGEGELADAGVAAPTVTPADERLYAFLSGSWDTADQALVDARFYDIHLSICPVEAPELGARVLYVEQAMATTLTAPYRQRLYVVEAVPARDPATVARSRVYELAAPVAAIGACARPAPARFAAADAIERPGCAVTLAFDAATGAFTGGTDGRACLSTLRGATYATTEVRLDRTRLDSLDRGWNGSDAQVWGSTAGAYQFVRRTTPPQ